MSSTIKNFSIRYDRLNESDTFTNGDTVKGQIILDVGKECRLETLSMEFLGKARCLWEEKLGRSSTVCHSMDIYLLYKNFYVRDRKAREEDLYQPLLTDEYGRPYWNVVAPGCHFYPFTFQFLDHDMPSSFRGDFGKVEYTLEAKLTRSMRMDTKASTKLHFVSKAVVNNIHQLMTPQRRSTEKQMKLCISGSVAMYVNIDKMGYCQGEGMEVEASVRNDSSGDIRLLYRLYRGDSFHVESHQTRHKIQAVLKVEGDVIPAGFHQTVTRTITIPPRITPSMTNCKIIQVEYWLKVCLKVKFTSNPEVILPLVILPARMRDDLQDDLPAPSPSAPDLPPPHYSSLGCEAIGTPRCEASGGPRDQPAWTPTTDQWKDLEAALDALSQCAASPSPSHGSHASNRSSDV